MAKIVASRTFVLIAALLPGAALAVPTYHLLDLGMLPGGIGSVAQAISRTNGYVAGYANSSGTNAQHAMSWNAATGMVDLGTLGGRTSLGNGVNGKGQVVGSSLLAGNTTNHAFLYSSGAMTDLGTLGGANSDAYSVNETGKVAGRAQTSAAQYHAFLYSSGAMTDLGTLGGTFSSAWSINATNMVAGSAFLASGATHGFVYSAGTMTDIGTLGGSTSNAWAINDAGTVVGDSTVASGVSHAVMFSGGQLTDLGGLAGDSHAYAINRAGTLAVGDGRTSSNDIHAVLFQDGKAYDLNTRLDAPNGFVLGYGLGIDNSGRIVAYAQEIGGGTPHAVMLTPVPEPTTMAGLTLGVLALLRRKRR